MSKKVVCIEDDPDILDLLTLVLDDPEYTMVPVLGGEDGFTTIQETQPDLIVMDLLMPKVTGWDIFRKMQEDDSLRDTPVIVVSACHEKVNSALGIDDSIKATAYISKPFSPLEVRATVDRALGLIH